MRSDYGEQLNESAQTLRMTGKELKDFVAKVKDNAEVPYGECEVQLTLDPLHNVRYRRIILWQSLGVVEDTSMARFLLSKTP